MQKHFRSKICLPLHCIFPCSFCGRVYFFIYKTVYHSRWHFYCCVFCSGGSVRVAELFYCSVVSFALPFSLGIEATLWQLVLLFIFVSSPVPHHFGTQNIRVYVVLILMFCCTRSGLFLPFKLLFLFCLFLLGFLGACSYPVCPPVDTVSIGTPDLVMFIHVHFACTTWLNHYPQRSPVSPQAPFPCPTISLGPTTHTCTHKYPPWTHIVLSDPLW